MSEGVVRDEMDELGKVGIGRVGRGLIVVAERMVIRATEEGDRVKRV